MTALSALREVLPPAESAGKADTVGLIRAMTIAVADAFSLDIIGEGEARRLVPILHRAGAQDDAPLLPLDQQCAFGEQQFSRFSSVRHSTPSATAHTLCFRHRSARHLPKCAAFRAHHWRPGAHCSRVRVLFFGRHSETTSTARSLRMCSVKPTPILSGFLGLGCGKRASCPGSNVRRTTGLVPGPTKRVRRPTSVPEGVGFGSTTAQSLSADEAESLGTIIKAAVANGDQTVSFTSNGETFTIPATAETLVALSALQDAYGASSSSSQSKDIGGAERLLIRPNEWDVEVKADWTPRNAQDPGTPTCIRTFLRAHQKKGVRWLQDAWTQGRPGVLLADDMGLGKTLQALTFLRGCEKACVVETWTGAAECLWADEPLDHSCR